MEEKKIKRTAVDVYTYIYEAIASGKYPMGSAISEAEIAKELNISRSPVREALKKLEGEDIIKHYPNRGAFVTEVSVQDIQELYDLRALLEVYAVKNTIKNLDPSAWEGIRQTFMELGPDSPTEAYHDANQQLHRMIISASGNRRLGTMYQMLNAQIAILNFISTESPKDFVKSREEHLAIIESIQNKDERVAEENIVSHIEHIKQNTIRKFLNNWQ